jgi:DNA-binding IscR family transcriptional regulator
LCAILEHELGLAQDNHQRGQTQGNDVTPKSGQESFQAWLQRHAQGFIDATSWEEFHGIADAHGVPSRFLVQILLQLKSAGLVQSIRGAAGGYQLAKEPDEITLLDVMTVVDAQVGQSPTSAARNTGRRR